MGLFKGFEGRPVAKLLLKGIIFFRLFVKLLKHTP
jgi:hypothetical protein